MPELPELEVVREILSRRLRGRRIEEVTLSPRGGPIVARDLTGKGFREGLLGSSLRSVRRRGKFLWLELDPPPLMLAVNPKLTGRFQLCPPGGKKAGQVHLTLHFDRPAEELRYIDRKRMGQLYLTEDLAQIPTFEQMGPEALGVPLDLFRERLRRFRGEIKGVLSRERFLAGIGNAYADEILWQAKIHPYKRSTQLGDEEIERLHAAVQKTLIESTEKVRAAMGEDIHRKPRHFFAVHMRGGESCPRCGSRISDIRARGRITNFCRTCQPGGLVQGV